MKRTFLFAASMLSGIFFTASAFDWPQKEIESDLFYSYFAQLRGGTVSSSLVFKDSAEVKASGDGTVTAIISDHGDDFGWFESSLGNTVIVSHKDGLSTVYGNLDEDSIPSKFESYTEVSSGDFLGNSGNSGWQEGESCLEFKVFDTKNSASINPRILMPRIGKELRLSTGTITLVDKQGVSHNLLLERQLPAGQYFVYRTRQPVAMPAKTIVSVNGATVESISYDTLLERNGRLGAKGNSHYSVDEIYPDSSRHLLANIPLNKGHIILTITVVDILGLSSSITYNLEII